MSGTRTQTRARVSEHTDAMQTSLFHPGLLSVNELLLLFRPLSHLPRFHPRLAASDALSPSQQQHHRPIDRPTADLPPPILRANTTASRLFHLTTPLPFSGIPPSHPPSRHAVRFGNRDYLFKATCSDADNMAVIIVRFARG